MLAGFVYVAFVVDVFSRRVLGWRVSSCRQTRLVLDAFGQALAVPHRHNARWTADGLVHHSDAACPIHLRGDHVLPDQHRVPAHPARPTRGRLRQGHTRRAEIFHQLITGVDTTEAS
jgi:hypothetical protein